MKRNLWKRICVFVLLILISALGVLIEVGVLDPNRGYDYPVQRFSAECIQKLDFRDDSAEGKGLDNAMTTIFLRHFATALEKKAENHS